MQTEAGFVNEDGDVADRYKENAARAYGLDQPGVACDTPQRAQWEKQYARQLSMQGQRFEDSAYGRDKLKSNRWLAALMDTRAYMSGGKGNGYDYANANGSRTAFGDAVQEMVTNSGDAYSPLNNYNTHYKDQATKLGLSGSAAAINLLDNANIKDRKPSEKSVVVRVLAPMVDKAVEAKYPGLTDAVVREQAVVSEARGVNAATVDHIIDIAKGVSSHQTTQVIESVRGVLYQPNAQGQHTHQQTIQTIQHLGTLSRTWNDRKVQSAVRTLNSQPVPAGQSVPLYKLNANNVQKVVEHMNNQMMHHNNPDHIVQFVSDPNNRHLFM
jgi:hypothetical protein